MFFIIEIEIETNKYETTDVTKQTEQTDTDTEMSQLLKCHLNFNVTKTDLVVSLLVMNQSNGNIFVSINYFLFDFQRKEHYDLKLLVGS